MFDDTDQDPTVRQLLADLRALKEMDRRRLATRPGSEARERATEALDRKNAEVMDRFRLAQLTARSGDRAAAGGARTKPAAARRLRRAG